MCHASTRFEDVQNQATFQMGLNISNGFKGEGVGEGEIELFGSEIGCRGDHCMSSMRS